jgi:hypothetical protein
MKMYRKQPNRQLTIYDFDQPLGLTMNPENRWVKKAASIPWSVIEDKYAALFNSDRGNIAKPVRMALGALIIQSEFQYSDIETVNQIRENPYLQYFVGLHSYKDEKPFDASLMVHFRKRLSSEILIEINEFILNPAEDIEKDSQADDNDNDSPKSANEGTLLLDATCAPSEIRFPQDTELLNECREKLEGIIDVICEANHLPKPRTYRKVARKDYLNIARKKKKSGKQIRKAIGKQLNYIRRDFGYIDAFLDQGYTLVPKQAELLATLRKLYEQQLYMYTSRTHKVQDRIVSISQPFIRPIVRGKAKNPVEFGAKLDMSITNGYARIEKISFDAYNESECLIVALERYKERMGVYPERVLADKIYRNRTNLSYCKQLGIRLSGPSLGRPKKDKKVDKKQEYIDNCDRVEVERGFSLAKRKYGLRLIRTRLEETSLCVIALSILTMNLSKVSLRIFLNLIRWMRLPRMEPLVIP